MTNIVKITPFTYTGGIDWQTMRIAPGGFWRVDGRYFEFMFIQIRFVDHASYNAPKETKRKISIKII